MTPEANTEATNDPTSGTFSYLLDGCTIFTGSYDDCGKRYVASGMQGTIIKLGTVAHAAPQPSSAAAPPPAPPVAYSVGPRSSEQAAKEIAVQGEIIKSKLGLAMPPTLYAPGTELLDIGKATYKAIVREWADTPKIEDACEEAALRIDAEKRCDVGVLDMSTLTWGLDSRDVLTLSRGGGAIPVEEAALTAFLSRYAGIFPRARQFLLALDPDQRVEVLNRQTRKIGKLDEKARAGVFRSRKVGGAWQFFAAVSPSYAARDGNHVLRDYAAVLRGEGMRGTVMYDAARTLLTVRASWNAPETLDAHVGDVINAGLYGRTGDAGNAGHSVHPMFTRIRCLNCTTVTASGRKVRTIHTGSVDTFAANVRNAISAIPDAFADFAAAWGIARATKFSGSVEDRIAAMVDSGEISAAVGRDAMVEALLTAYKVEPGDTNADILNALTRAAHDGPFDEPTRAAMESDAGRLLYVYADGSVAGAR